MAKQFIDIAEADIRAAESRFRQNARFLLDFSIGGSQVKTFLTERGWDVESANAILQPECTDHELVDYANRSKRILLVCDKKVTHDMSFPHLRIPGLIVLRTMLDYQTVLPNVLRTLAVMTAFRGSFPGSKVIVMQNGEVRRLHKEPESSTILTIPLTTLSLGFTTQGIDAENKYDILLAMWKAVSKRGLQSYEKGRRLEEFTENFFADVFRLVESRLNTENGELDLILEVQQMKPFWIMFGSDALVECKNWKSRSPLSDAAAFCYKASLSRDIKLAFLVSMNGFTRDAMGTLRNNARDTKNPLVVPISGVKVEGVLRAKQPVEEFLKNKIRSMRLHTK